MNKIFSFNKIIVIQSLSIGEIQTGENLYNDLLRWESEKNPKLLSEFIPVNSKIQLISTFARIKNDIITNGNSPFIHFEIHGSDKKDGLVLNSGELVSWIELADCCREINLISQNNLTVSLATCYGAHIYGALHLSKPTPFWAFIAPWEEVETGDAEVSFYAFFETFLKGLQLHEAVKALNEFNQLPYRYFFYDAEEIFNRVYSKYEEDNFSPEGFRKRVLTLIGDALSNHDVRNRFTIPEIKLMIEKRLIEDKDEYKEKYKSKFLMK